MTRYASLNSKYERHKEVSCVTRYLMTEIGAANFTFDAYANTYRTISPGRSWSVWSRHCSNGEICLPKFDIKTKLNDSSVNTDEDLLHGSGQEVSLPIIAVSNDPWLPSSMIHISFNPFFFLVQSTTCCCCLSNFRSGTSCNSVDG